jgi:hypothetical protein
MLRWKLSPSFEKLESRTGFASLEVMIPLENNRRGVTGGSSCTGDY